MHAHIHAQRRKHTHAHILPIHIFCLSNETNHWGNLICKSRRERALKPQEESSFRRRLMVRMREMMEHCMPREKSDLQLYFDTYSLLLKQSMDSLTYCFLLPKTFWPNRICAFYFLLLLTMSNLISYLHKQSNLCLKLYTWKIILHPAGNIVPDKKMVEAGQKENKMH